jgi:hypothetical protein
LDTSTGLPPIFTIFSLGNFSFGDLPLRIVVMICDAG